MKNQMNRKYLIFLQFNEVLIALIFSKNNYLFNEKLRGFYTEGDQQRCILGDVCFHHQQNKLHIFLFTCIWQMSFELFSVPEA